MMKWWTIELIILYDVIVVRCFNSFYIIFYITLHELSCLAIRCNSRFWICERQCLINTIRAHAPRTPDYGPWTNLRGDVPVSCPSLVRRRRLLTSDETSSWHQSPQSRCESTWHPGSSMSFFHGALQTVEAQRAHPSHPSWKGITSFCVSILQRNTITHT